MVSINYKKIIEYRFMFEFENDVKRWLERLDLYIYSFAHMESIVKNYDGNIGYLKLMIFDDVYQNEENYLKLLIDVAKVCDDCHYIEETINEVNQFVPVRTYQTRII